MRRARIIWAIVTLIALCVAAVLVVSLQKGGITTDSSHRQRSAEIMTASVGDMLDAYKKEHGRLPSAEEGLNVLYPKFSNSRELVDRWGHPFVYSPTPGGSRPFVLYSIGENGVDEKGRGDDIDVWKMR